MSTHIAGGACHVVILSYCHTRCKCRQYSTHDVASRQPLLTFPKYLYSFNICSMEAISKKSQHSKVSNIVKYSDVTCASFQTESLRSVSSVSYLGWLGRGWVGTWDQTCKCYLTMFNDVDQCKKTSHTSTFPYPIGVLVMVLADETNLFKLLVIKGYW